MIFFVVIMWRFLSGHIFSKFRGAYPKRMLRTDHQYNLQGKTSMQAIQRAKAIQRVKTTQHVQQDGSARRKQVVEVQGRSSSARLVNNISLTLTHTPSYSSSFDLYNDVARRTSTMLLVGIIGPRVGLGGIGSSAKSCSPSIASFRMPWQLRNPHIQTKLRLRCFAQASSRRWPTRRDQQSDQQSDQQRRAKAASCISKSHGTVFSTPYPVPWHGMQCNLDRCVSASASRS